MEIGKKSKSGLLQRAQTVLADVTPTFANWAKRSGFTRAAILSPCSTSEGKFYYTTDAVGFSAREMALLTETQEFWMRTLSKAFEWQCFSRDFNELDKFDGLFDDDVLAQVSKIFFLPFRNKERPMIFLLLELEDDDDLYLPQSSEIAVTLKNIVEFKNQTKKILAKFDKNIDTGLGISQSRLYLLSLKVCIEEELSTVELPGDELRELVTRSITDAAQTIVSPLFRAPNCSQTGSKGEIKVVLFAKDEEDEQLLAYHIARTLIGLLGTKATKQILLLSAGLCANKTGTIEFLCKC
ncbi:hypothetical protein DYE50_07730 [Treponema ruminis]|uniref:Uncharacterized protein n=1 Tax=Treponema ruminis TaxID=744515 RepID=A0A7W8LLS1_9SPIR|nr:hypothetical protein [Treponema ruminis]MBB5225767.1 hypothetical protein [Treponema ruminis]QSI02457.1 hypothetical protein DYE50_07730 [Treponema ruminis]